MSLEDLKKIKEADRNSTYIPTRWNSKELKNLNELQALLGEEKVSTAIKKGVEIALNVLQHTFGKEVVISICKRKREF